MMGGHGSLLLVEPCNTGPVRNFKILDRKTKGSLRHIFKNGSIDEVCLWRRALSQTEIEEVMKGFLAVSVKDKLASMWGDIKKRLIRD